MRDVYREFHALGTGSPKLTANDNLTALGATLHDESEYTVARPSDRKSVEQLVPKRLALGDGRETTVLDFGGVQRNRVLGEFKSLLDEGRQFTNAAALFT